MPNDWVHLQLDLETFDDAEFEPYLERCRDAGLEFTILTTLLPSP